ncbi:MAG TPA: FmdB family zinc ribbon protein [Fimbriimonadaceae bacterium]|nr:FmdB family zinc ribbon protein [Fimbriimonadaceae bacterium]
MPTYVYECSACSQTFEVEQRITENPLTQCRCGSEGTVKRLIQPVAISFKGSGFHINDYKGPATETKSEDKPVEAATCTGDKSACACTGTAAVAPAP